VVTSGKVLRHTTSLALLEGRLEDNLSGTVSREKGGVQIMDGSDEGVYAWITTNYLLGKIGGPT
jgi:Golgi nucleoside diphosphatase